MNRKLSIFLILITLCIPSITCAGMSYGSNDLIQKLASDRGKEKSSNEVYDFSIPTEDYIEVKSVPDLLTKLESYLAVTSKRNHVDLRVTEAISAVSFKDYGDSLSETAANLANFLDKVLPQLSSNIQRYNGNYALAIEALEKGTSDIDLIYELYGEDWEEHIQELDTLTGNAYLVTQTDSLTSLNTSDLYYRKVFSYIPREEEGE